LVAELHRSLGDDGAGWILDSTADLGGLRVHSQGTIAEKQE
jgi:hypothetical protein